MTQMTPEELIQKMEKLNSDFETEELIQKMEKLNSDFEKGLFEDDRIADIEELHKRMDKLLLEYVGVREVSFQFFCKDKWYG